MDIVYQVWSDSFSGDLLTPDAYDFVLASMNTGDYALHRSTKVLIENLVGNNTITCYDEVNKELCAVDVYYTKDRSISEVKNYV
jgi:hypothetical protein